MLLFCALYRLQGSNISSHRRFRAVYHSLYSYVWFILRFCQYLIISESNGSINDRRLVKYFKASDRGVFKVLTWNPPERKEQKVENSMSGESLPWLRNYPVLVIIEVIKVT